MCRISDSLSVRDRENVVVGMEHSIQVVGILVARRSTRLVLRGLGETCSKLYQTNKKQIFRKILILHSIVV